MRSEALRIRSMASVPRGFTLIEAVMVMVITGILAAMVAVFIVSPTKGYLDTARRADMTDAADTALRRLAREVRLALPNSVRVGSAGGINYLEFIMTSAGGRYRASGDGSTGGNILDFTNASNKTFDVLGPAPAFSANDYIVVYNLGTGYSPADAYEGLNRAQVSSVAGHTVTLTTNPFAAETPPLPSPSDRFQVVPSGTQAVTYACPVSTAGNVTRYWHYGFNVTPVFPPSGGSSAVAMSNTTCEVGYAQNVSFRNALLYVKLNVIDSASGESVSVFEQIHVDNSP